MEQQELTSKRWRRVKEIFQDAVERPAAERKTYLADACAGAPSLLTEVESLLTAHEEPGSFMDTPAFNLAEGPASAALLGKSIGRYRILSLLGRGGMGEVYKAKDTTLGRDVAIKVLPSGFSIDHDRLRLLEQEARAASALNHPNIITIHEFGQEEGVRFIVSEFIEGETLRRRIRGGQIGSERTASERMNAAEILEIAIQIASALNEAHEAGIIHRDIKPENVMVRPDGLVKVLDFGLAKLVERRSFDTVTNTNDRSNDASGATTAGDGTGVVMGTVSYMSPEQARGERLDARSDLFSLGVALYEMAAGHSPFARETFADTMASILDKEPPPLAQFTSEVPEAMEQIIRKALSKDREERYQTARELLEDLKRLKSAVAPVASSPAKREPLRGAIKQRWRAAAIALAAMITVVASAIYFNESGKAIESITVLPFVNNERERLAKRQKVNPEAHLAYQQGRYQWNKRTGAGFRKAIEYFNEAIAKDPDYAQPYSGLADCYALMEGLSPILSPNEAYPKAKEAAMKALRIDNQSAEAHASLGRIKMNYDWDWPGAEKEFRLAIQIDPNYPTAHQWYSVYLTYLGRHTDAIAEAQQAYALDPVSLATSRELAGVYYRARRYDDAIAQCQKMLDLDPQAYVRLRDILELVYEQLGRYDQAVAERVKALTFSGSAQRAAALRAAYDRSGWKGYLQKTADSLIEPVMLGKVGSFSLAKVYARLGDKDRTFEWLEKAYAERSGAIISIRSDPSFDWLHADSRFQNLLSRIGLPPY
jgi:serine/threonine protein kinase/Flp pilus assembly protein TadD